MSKATVLFADDQPLFRDLVSLFLEAEWTLVGAVEDGEALVREASRLLPDIVLTDISMPGLGGIEAALQLRDLQPAPRVIFLSSHTEPDTVDRALNTGAHGYLVKSCWLRELRPALHAVVQGGRFVSSELSAQAPPPGDQI